MIVNKYRTYHVSKPLKQPLKNSVYSFTHIEHVLLELDADGMTGIGYAFAFAPAHAKAIRTIMADFAETLIGKEVENIRRHWMNSCIRIKLIGQTGLPVIALAPVDTALWDLLSQKAGMPLYRMWGAVRDEVPVYSSGGWLGPVQDLVEEAVSYKGMGFKDYKMKVGFPDYREDLKRVEAVRRAVGDDMNLMVDVNQGWSVKTAITAGKALEKLGVNWLEEPLPAQDIAGHARIAKELDIHVATGESLFMRDEFLPLIMQGGADVIMPDLQCCGGPTEWLQVASLADTYRIPVSSHIFPEVSAHLMAACPNGTMIEYIPGWWDDLFEVAPRVINAKITLSSKPGLGIKFDHDVIQRFSAD